MNSTQLIVPLRSDDFMPCKQFFVRDITRSDVEKRPAVYRWWFNEISLSKENVKDGLIDKGQILTAIVDKDIYYALYVGKAKSAYKRLFCHLPGENGNRIGFRTSTLRRTLRALLCKPNQSPVECAHIVDEYMRKHAILEWRYFDTESEAKCFETKCIEQGYYILNNSENDKLSTWTSNLTELRKMWQ